MLYPMGAFSRTHIWGFCVLNTKDCTKAHSYSYHSNCRTPPAGVPADRKDVRGIRQTSYALRLAIAIYFNTTELICTSQTQTNWVMS